MKNRNNKSVNKDNKNKININKKLLRNVSIISIIVIIIILVAIYSFYYYNTENRKYQTRITSLGYNEIYNNKKATFYESVTKMEVLKMVFTATYNRSDIENLGLNLEDCNSDEEKWLK